MGYMQYKACGVYHTQVVLHKVYDRIGLLGGARYTECFIYSIRYHVEYSMRFSTGYSRYSIGYIYTRNA